MTNEEFYDNEIAPKLMELAAQCQERGMAFIACVEYDPPSHGIGRTEYCPPDDSRKLSASQRLTHWSARSKGNVDALIMAIDKHAKEHGHSSVYLRMLGNDNVKYTGEEVYALAVQYPKT